MKILLFGVTGQLGYEITLRANDLHFSLIAPVEMELDLTDEREVLNLAASVKPDIVINCAAYTAVDKAEEDEARCLAVNRDGAVNAAKAAVKAGCRLLHISTDYVFDGQGSKPLAEGAPTNPQNVYGRSKLEGERGVLEVLPERSLIVRTSSLHGQKGPNFVHTMLKLLSERDVVQVVSDQYMCATWAGWLAEVVLDLSRINCQGIVHACGAGVISWYEFAKGIAELSYAPSRKQARIEPTNTASFPRPAKRPAFSAMDCGRLASLLGRGPISWREGLRCHLKELGELRAE